LTFLFFFVNIMPDVFSTTNSYQAGGSMGKINQLDRAMLEALCEDGILQEVLAEKLQFGAGVISLPCSDGDQSYDWRTFLGGLVVRHRGEVRDHAISLNGGGALLLSPESPLRTLSPMMPTLLDGIGSVGFSRVAITLFAGVLGRLWRQDVVVLANVCGAIALKSIRTIALQIHFPCGAAGLCGMDAREQLNHLVLAKRRLKRWFPKIQVPCFVHVDWGTESGPRKRKCVYFTKTHALADWLHLHS
jgi:hypothetical protein